MDFKIIFVHGYTASSKENWYPEIAKELTKLEIDFVIPNMPGGEYPHASEWLDSIHAEVLNTDKPVIFVGHSLGTRAIPLYLEKYQFKAKAVFLIAAFANWLENATKFKDEYYPDFFVHKIDVDNMKRLADKFVVIHSKDDPLDYQQGVEIANQLEAKLITFENRGHFSDPSNAIVILDILRREIGF